MPPIRLLDIKTMRVEMYTNIHESVKRDGYACISHVWGEQKGYSPEELGITGDVNWKIPLSHPKKLQRIKKAVQDHDMRYCWLDLVCIPQGDDREQDRVKEIPHMGDYYGGAKITFVLETKRVSTPDTAVNKTFGLIGPIVGTIATGSLRDAIKGYHDSNLMSRDEQWFERVWTFQEAVLSKKLIYVTFRGNYRDITDILDSISKAYKDGSKKVQMMFDENSETTTLSRAVDEYHEHKADLTEVLYKSCQRKCAKSHDRLYGVLSVLQYVTFPVTYDVSMEDLNKSAIRYAHSRGDISWLSVGGNVNKGFIQPMYEKFARVGRYWKQSNNQVKFENNALYIDVYPVAKIQCCESAIRTEFFVGWMVDMFRSWKIPNSMISRVLLDYDDTDPKYCEQIRDDLDNIKLDQFGKVVIGFFSMNSSRLNGLDDNKRMHKEITVAISHDEKGEMIPLIICGKADIGDEIMLVEMYDYKDRMLGIVTSGHERKGVCLYPKTYISRDLCVSHKFLV
jgi:hypothetical protein